MELKYFFTDAELWGAMFCMLASVYLFLGRTVIKKEYRALSILELTVGILLFSDGLAWYYRGVPGEFARGMVIGSNFVTFLMNPVIPIFVSIYVILSVYEGKKDYTIFYAIAVIAIFAEIMFLFSQRSGYIYRVNPDSNLYERGPGFPLWTFVNMSEALICILYLTYKRKKVEKCRFIAVFCFILLPILAAGLQVFVYGYSLYNMACLASALFMLAQAIQDNSKNLLKQQVMISTKESELSNLRNKIALSQIRPQFIYSTLDYTKELCERDPKRAKDLVSWLSEYIKGNKGFSEKGEMIMFSGELNHTMTFLEIEKVVLEDAFEVEYDIREKDFELPALTLQPVVENAVRHGIRKLAPGTKGIIKISTLRGNGYIKIEVKDNGVGFDTGEITDNPDYESEMHGLKNVEERLRIMENAEMHVKSYPGRGTTVEIIIPV